MDEISKKHGFGYSLNLDDIKAADKLYDFYENINWELFYNSCDEFINIAKKEKQNFTNIIRQLL